MKPKPIEGRPGWVTYSFEPGQPLSDEVKANLEELKSMPDSEIDTSDIPEWTDEMWARCWGGRKMVWLRGSGGIYQNPAPPWSAP